MLKMFCTITRYIFSKKTTLVTGVEVWYILSHFLFSFSFCLNSFADDWSSQNMKVKKFWGIGLWRMVEMINFIGNIIWWIANKLN